MGKILETVTKIQENLNTNFGIRFSSAKALNTPEFKIRCFTTEHKHNDTTPALSIKEKNGSMFKCFVCGISGKNNFDIILHYIWHLYLKSIKINNNNFKNDLHKYNISEKEYNKITELKEKFKLDQNLRDLIKKSENEKIQISNLRDNKSLENAAQEIYKDLYNEEFNIDEVFNIKYDNKKEIKNKQEILNLFYKEIFKINNGKPSQELIKYFENRGIIEKTLKNRGIIDFKDEHLPKVIDTMSIYFSNKIKNITNEEIKNILESFKDTNLKKYTYDENKKEYFFQGKKLTNEETEQLLKKIKGLLFLVQNSFLKNGEIPFKNNKIIMPFLRSPKYNENPNEKYLESIQFRSIDPKTPKKNRFMGYGSLTLYNKDLLEKNNNIIIYEGGTDANTAIQLADIHNKDYTAISIPGAGSKLSIYEISLFLGKNVYIMGDNDAPGLEFVDKISKLIGPVINNPNEKNEIEKLEIPESDVKDFNDWQKKYNKDNKIEPISKYIKNIEVRPSKYNLRINNIVKKEENTIIGINSTMDNNSIGKVEDIFKYIKENNIKTFSISDRTIINLNKYIEFAKQNNINFIPSIKVKLGGITDIILNFEKVEDLKITLKKIKENTISLKDLKELPKDVHIILPSSLNKELLKSNFLENANSKNIYIGLKTSTKLDFLPNNYAFKPIFINDNKFINKEDKDSYIIYKNIKQNYKLDKQKYKNGDYNNSFDLPIINTNELIDSVNGQTIKNKNRNETQLKNIYKTIINNTKEFINNIQVEKDFKIVEKPNLPFYDLITREDEQKLLKFKEENSEEKYKEYRFNLFKDSFRKVLFYMWDKKSFEKSYKNNEKPPIVYKIDSMDLSSKIDTKDKQKYINRINNELQVISSFNDETFFNYFIILVDLLQHLKQNNFKIGYGRGSAAGSLVAYLLNIHDIDPIKYNLYFERFLNKGRFDYPDIDIDMSNQARNFSINYLKEKYPNKVATFAVETKLGIKSTVSDTLRILGYSSKVREKISNDIDKNYKGDLEELESFKNILKEIPNLKNTINTLIGENFNYTQHVSAVIVDNEEFNYDTLEEKNNLKVLNINNKNLNKIKYDLLNSKNMEIMETVLKFIKNKEFEYSIDKLDVNNKEIFKNIAEDNFLGIPQLDSERKTIREYKEKYYKEIEVDNIMELSNFLALIRPGAMLSKKEYSYNKRINKIYNINNKDFNNLLKKYNINFDTTSINKIVELRKMLKRILKGNGIDFTEFNKLKNNIKVSKTNIKKIISDINKLIEATNTFEEKLKNEKLLNKLKKEYDFVLTINANNKEDLKNTYKKIYKKNPENEEALKEFYNKIIDYQNLYYNNELSKNKHIQEITKDTYGTIIYQEQIMEILNKMCHITLEETNLIRKALSKKNKEELQKYKNLVIDKLKENEKDLNIETINFLWEKILKTSEYAYNKSHSISYAYITFAFMELKVKHYPLFYLAVKEVKPKIDLKINEKYIQKPKINISKENYYIDKNKIIEPLKSLNLFKRNKPAMIEILEGQKFKDFDDMIARTNRQIINKSVIREMEKEGFIDKSFIGNSIEYKKIFQYNNNNPTI